MDTKHFSTLLDCSTQVQFDNWIRQNKTKLYLTEFDCRRSAINEILNTQMKIRKSFYSQANLAKDIGVDASTINRFINGSRHPGKYLWFKIALFGKFNYIQLQDFMTKAGYILNPGIQVDAILIFCHANKRTLTDIYEQLQYYDAPESVITSMFPEVK